MIIGTWKLQTQHIGIYINDVSKVQSESSASDQSKASITFNSDGSYIATAAFGLNGLIPLGQPGSAGYIGNYSPPADTVLTMKPFFIGTLWLDTTLAPPTAIMFSNKIVTETAAIDQLSSSLLTFHTEIVIQQTVDFKTRIITTKTSYNYTR